jgi:hypothetical protein
LGFFFQACYCLSAVSVTQTNLVLKRFFLLCCLSPSPSLIWLVHGVVRTFPLAIEHSTGVIELRRPMGSLAVLCAATFVVSVMSFARARQATQPETTSGGILKVYEKGRSIAIQVLF